MENDKVFLNLSGATVVGLAGVAVSFGVQFLYAKKENKRNEELLKQMSQLNDASAQRLKKLISDSSTELAKTQVIIEFLTAEKIKELEADSKKKRILPLIGLGLGVVLLGLIFYKLHKQNG